MEDPPRPNAFRVLGLDVYVSPREIWHQEQILGRRHQPQGARTTRGPLPLPAPPAKQQVVEALRRLRSPASRLIDELFWFWPDQMLPGLSSHPDRVLLNWTSKESTPDSWQATHSLAVFYLAKALDYESQDILGSGLAQNQSAACVACWSRAIRRWRSLREWDGPWRQFMTRVEHLKDSRVGPELTPAIRQSLETILLRALIALIVRARRSNRMASFNRLVGLVNQTGYEPAMRVATARAVLTPLVEELKIIQEFAKRSVHDNPRTGTGHIRGLLEASKPVFDVFEQLLPKADAFASTVGDEVAAAVLASQIEASNVANDWKGAMENLIAAQPLAFARKLRERLEENIRIVKDNVRQSIL
jgi:hypothetical protein